MTEISLADLTADHFEPLIGRDFRVAHPDHSETLTLERVARSGSKGAPHRQFSLFLRGRSTTVMFNQNTLPLESDALGRLELFTVPIGRDADGRFQYQIVFN